MVRTLSNLVIKEIREMIRDPKILLGMVLMPLIVFPVMGAAMNVSTSAVEESLKEVTIAIMDLDQGYLADDFVQFLDSINVTLIHLPLTSVDLALKSLQGSKASALIIIPRDFSSNITSGLRGELMVYSIFRSLGFSESSKAYVANAPVEIYERILVNQAINESFPGKDPETILDPIISNNSVVFKDKIIDVSPEVVQNIFMSQSFGFPTVIMLLLISAMQIAATSISIEKEEKTLETLLTLPVSRLSILTGKLAGSVIIAIAGAAAALIGVNFYTSSIFNIASTENVNLDTLGLGPTPLSYVLLGIVMFVTIVSALALALCVATFSDNVRNAQSLVMPLNILVVVPSLMLIFADIEILPPVVQVFMYAIPYTHSILASRAAFTGDLLVMFQSIAYISAFTIIILYITTKIFSTERIITARISLQKLRLNK